MRNRDPDENTSHMNCCFVVPVCDKACALVARQLDKPGDYRVVVVATMRRVYSRSELSDSEGDGQGKPSV